MIQNIYRNSPFVFSLCCLSIVASLVGFANPQIISIYGMHSVFILQGDYLNLAIQALLFQFFHGSFLHLLSNLFFLIVIGVGMETVIGSKRM